MSELHPEALVTNDTTPTRDTICDPRFWRRRLREAERLGQLHHAVFKCPKDRWLRIEEKHRVILRRHVYIDTSILDVGCGWGRLLTLLPAWWRGAYIGVDLSPDFARRAKEQHPDRRFLVGDARNLGQAASIHQALGKFDLAVAVSFRPMIRRHLGDEEWAKIEANVRKVAKSVLYLEYDESDEGSLE